MALGFAVTLRNARADQVSSARDAGSTGGLIRIYNGVRPATGGAVTSLLAELAYATTSAGAASGGVLTASAIVGDTSANASGLATWFREVDSNGVHVMDGDVGVTASGKDMEINDVNVVVSQPVDITSAVLTEGNA